MPHFSGVITAGGFAGDLVGNVQGSVIGDVTGTLIGGQILPTQSLAANGAITIKTGLVVLAKTNGAVAATIGSPATADNGKVLHILSLSDQAHTVTYETVGFNGAGTNGDVATFAGTAGNSMSLVAYGQKWYTLDLNNVTLG